MTFADYLEFTSSKARRDLLAMSPEAAPLELRIFPSRERVLELFAAAHVFNLGEADDINEAGEQLRGDLHADFETGVPAPFDNMAVAFHRPEGWGFEWHLKLTPHLPKALPGLPPEAAGRDFWLTVDLSEPLSDLPAFTYLASYQVLPPQNGLLALGLSDDSLRRAERIYQRPREEAGFIMSEGLGAALRRIALISHPSNYLVRTSPKLTPREERQVGKRGVPVRKRPFYIVIEHEVLVGLNPKTRGAAAGSEGRAPVPHARRGHWMRLAERCLAARAGGKERVWRKETYVGEREFEDEKNRYQVVLGVRHA